MVVIAAFAGAFTGSGMAMILAWHCGIGSSFSRQKKILLALVLQETPEEYDIPEEYNHSMPHFLISYSSEVSQVQIAGMAAERHRAVF